jgi:hypothetical protein
MTRVSRSGAYLLFTIICLGEAACLRRLRLTLGLYHCAVGASAD